MVRNNPVGNLFSNGDIKKMINDNYFNGIMFIYKDVYNNRNKSFEFKLRVLISREIIIYKKHKKEWFFGKNEQNKNKIDEIIKEYNESKKKLGNSLKYFYFEPYKMGFFYLFKILFSTQCKKVLKKF